MKNHRSIKFRKINLKKNYLLFFETGLILSLGILNLLTRIDISSNEIIKTNFEQHEEIVFLEKTIQTKQELKVPPPPRPVVPIEVPNDEIIEDEIIFMSSEIDFDQIITLGPPPLPQNENDTEEEQVFVVVEQPPVLINGLRDLQSKVIYPNVAVQANIEGRVVVQFVISKEGNVTKPIVLRGIGGGCDEEALRVIKLAKFKPGMQRGKPVPVKYTIPILFKMAKD
ncbi:energy transducer TonB [Balneola sp. EhC07]|uniref:energy transducer TonB n=1 Tax=Balneola sp. EhC07 TaxID=1849360 RepID=UPI0007F4FF29|nr:energy transducer TonB [Balneola sp. EhC07]OAN60774.1 energy transducer TonB [Balneola sp. EhC07]